MNKSMEQLVVEELKDSLELTEIIEAYRDLQEGGVDIMGWMRIR